MLPPCKACGASDNTRAFAITSVEYTHYMLRYYDFNGSHFYNACQYHGYYYAPLLQLIQLLLLPLPENKTDAIYHIYLQIAFWYHMIELLLYLFNMFVPRQALLEWRVLSHCPLCWTLPLLTAKRLQGSLASSA